MRSGHLTDICAALVPDAGFGKLRFLMAATCKPRCHEAEAQLLEKWLGGSGGSIRNPKHFKLMSGGPLSVGPALISPKPRGPQCEVFAGCFSSQRLETEIWTGPPPSP